MPANLRLCAEHCCGEAGRHGYLLFSSRSVRRAAPGVRGEYRPYHPHDFAFLSHRHTPCMSDSHLISPMVSHSSPLQVVSVYPFSFPYSRLASQHLVLSLHAVCPMEKTIEPVKITYLLRYDDRRHPRHRLSLYQAADTAHTVADVASELFIISSHFRMSFFTI